MARTDVPNIKESALEQCSDKDNLEEWCLLGYYTMWLLQEPYGITSQKTPFFIVTAVKTSNLIK
jgi:hypothetical protein